MLISQTNELTYRLSSLIPKINGIISFKPVILSFPADWISTSHPSNMTSFPMMSTVHRCRSHRTSVEKVRMIDIVEEMLQPPKLVIPEVNTISLMATATDGVQAQDQAQTPSPTPQTTPTLVFAPIPQMPSPSVVDALKPIKPICRPIVGILRKDSFLSNVGFIMPTQRENSEESDKDETRDFLRSELALKLKNYDPNWFKTFDLRDGINNCTGNIITEKIAETWETSFCPADEGVLCALGGSTAYLLRASGGHIEHFSTISLPEVTCHDWANDVNIIFGTKLGFLHIYRETILLDTVNIRKLTETVLNDSVNVGIISIRSTTRRLACQAESGVILLFDSSVESGPVWESSKAFIASDFELRFSHTLSFNFSEDQLLFDSGNSLQSIPIPFLSQVNSFKGDVIAVRHCKKIVCVRSTDSIVVTLDTQGFVGVFSKTTSRVLCSGCIIDAFFFTILAKSHNVVNLKSLLRDINAERNLIKETTEKFLEMFISKTKTDMQQIKAEFDDTMKKYKDKVEKFEKDFEESEMMKQKTIANLKGLYEDENSYQKKKYESMIEDQIRKSFRQLDEKQHEIREVRKEAEKKHMEMTVSFHITEKQLHSQASKYLLENEKKKRTIRLMRNDLVEAQKRIEMLKLKEENNTLQLKAKHKEDAEMLEAEIWSLKAMCAQLNKQREVVAEENEKMDSLLKIAKRQLAHMREENIRQEDDLKNLTDTIEKMRSEQSILKKNYAGLKKNSVSQTKLYNQTLYQNNCWKRRMMDLEARIEQLAECVYDPRKLEHSVLSLLAKSQNIDIDKPQCPTSQLIDAAYFSQEVPKLRKMLGGHTDVDIIFPFFKEGSILGNVVIQCTCDLECHDFDSFFTRSCRWHNEKNGCYGNGDELDWIRMRGAWGQDGESVFMKTDKPDGFFLLVGIQKKLPELYSAMLVSDPIQCQQGDGLLKFRYWTSPGVKVRVCTRPPSMGRKYSWCSESVKRKNSKNAIVVIPGSILNMFEIVIEAYGFTLDAFGAQGGAAALDDISYNATAIYECQMLPHIPKLLNITKTVCDGVKCDFDSGTCLEKLGKKWQISDEAVGPKLTGILNNLDGDFGYIQGPGDASFTTGKLMIPRTYGLQFCFFSMSHGTTFEVVLWSLESKDKIILYASDPFDKFSKTWQCKRVFLSVNGTIEFSVKNMRNKYSYFGLDQIDVFDPTTNLSACDL
ncbi:unnamed protein product [Caenorhabditis sp. 36 PRJEB53466]|nr:unnamed protein product [Caenorhabditis sp. 36 PRJEB53466]